MGSWEQEREWNQVVEKQLRCDDEDLGMKKESERQYTQTVVSKEGWGA